MNRLFFFFSSRRRHTSWNCDWSSDVCSSDLARLVKEKKYADRNDDRRAHQPANRTRSACAADTVTHRIKPPKNGGRAVCASSKRPRQSEALAKKTAKCGTRETNQNCAAATAARRQSAGSARWGAL